MPTEEELYQQFEEEQLYQQFQREQSAAPSGIKSILDMGGAFNAPSVNSDAQNVSGPEFALETAKLGMNFLPYGRMAGAGVSMFPKVAGALGKVPLQSMWKAGADAFGSAGSSLGLDWLIRETGVDPAQDVSGTAALLEGGVGTAAGTVLPPVMKALRYPVSSIGKWFDKTFDKDAALMRTYGGNWQDMADVSGSPRVDEAIEALRGKGIIDNPAFAAGEKDEIFPKVRDALVSYQDKVGQEIGGMVKTFDQNNPKFQVSDIDPTNVLKGSMSGGEAAVNESVAGTEKDAIMRSIFGDGVANAHEMNKSELNKLLGKQKQAWEMAVAGIDPDKVASKWTPDDQKLLDHYSDQVNQVESKLAGGEVGFEDAWNMRRGYDDRAVQLAGQDKGAAYETLGNDMRGKLARSAGGLQPGQFGPVTQQGAEWADKNAQFSAARTMYNPLVEKGAEGGPVAKLAAESKVADPGNFVAYGGGSSNLRPRLSARGDSIVPGKTPEDNFQIATGTHPWQKAGAVGFGKAAGKVPGMIGGGAAGYAVGGPMGAMVGGGLGLIDDATGLLRSRQATAQAPAAFGSAKDLIAPARAEDGRPEAVQTKLLPSFLPDENPGNIPRHVGAVDPRMLGSMLTQFVPQQNVMPLAAQAARVFASKDQKEIARFLGALSSQYPDIPFERGPITGLASEFEMDDGSIKLFSDMDVQKWAQEIENSPLREDEKAQRLRALYTDGSVVPLDMRLNDFGPPLMQDRQSLMPPDTQEALAAENMMKQYRFSPRVMTPFGSAKSVEE